MSRDMMSENIVSWNLAVSPRAWQAEAIKKWEQNFRGIVSVVTGGGKTIFAFLCMLRFKTKFPAKNVLIVVPTLTLLDQWYVSLIEEFNLSENEIACFSSEEKSKTYKSVNILLINTARGLLPKLKSPEDYLIIVDECHRAGSEVNSKILQANYGATLGLSATPHRDYDDGFLRFIEPHLGHIIFEYDYKAALADKVISPFTLINVQAEFLEQEERSYARINKQLKLLLIKHEKDKTVAGAIKNCLIRRSRLSSSALMRIPITVKIVEDHKTERVLIFHESIQAADEIVEMLKKRAFPVSAYHSGISPVIRRNNLQMYKRGIYNILVTCKALDEGMNVPETTVAVISSSTASVRQRVQRLGRVLRPSPGKTKATVYTLYVTDQEKNRLVAEYKDLEKDVEITWVKVNH